MAQKKNNHQGSLAIEKEKSNGTEGLANQMCAIFEKTGVPQNIYVDTGVSYEPWKKEDIEKFFPKMIQATKKTDRQGTSQAVSEKIAGQVLSEHIRVADTYRKLERKAIHHHMNVCNALHQEKDTDF